jgi:hypothetical protein
MTAKEGQQQRLQVFKNVVPINPADPAPIEPTTGQTQLFDVQAVLKPLEDMFSTKMESLEQQNKALTGQISRLGSSVASLTNKLDDKVVHHKEANLVISPHQDLDAADVAWVDSALPSEAYYPYTTGDLAQPVGIHASRLGHFFKSAGIQGDPKFHCALKTGKMNYVQKYRGSALKALFEAASAGKVPDMKIGEIQKLQKYFELQRAMSQ